MKARPLIACLLLTAACSETPGATPDLAVTPDSGIRDGRVSPDGQLQLSFSSCTLLTDPSKPWTGPGFEGAESAMAECATMSAPAVWSNPTGDTITLFVKRYPAAQQPAKGQLWMLSGGPGDAGTYFEFLSHRIASSIPSLDIYMPNHRGTGKSSFANCVVTPLSASACVAKFPHLDGLTTTDAARDVAALIDATRTASQQVFLYGVSYGTYWAQRYLQVRPDQPTAVILDSTVPAVGFNNAAYDKQFDDTAHTVLSLCSADATCSVKLGPDPLAKAMQALAAVDGGQCKTPQNNIRKTFGQLVSGIFTYYEPLLLPAAVYRILRCNAADQTWLSKVSAFAVTGWSMSSYPMQPGSDVVLYNIVFSELWLDTRTPSEFQAQEKTMVAYDGWPAVAASLAPLWPRYPHDAYYGSWPSSPAAILVLQGTLDARTPYGTVVKAHYSGANQYYVELPRANHGVSMLESARTTDPNDVYGCGWQVIRSFLADPAKPPDTSCTAKMAPLDWGNPPAWWLARVGIKDLWENP